MATKQAAVSGKTCDNCGEVRRCIEETRGC